MAKGSDEIKIQEAIHDYRLAVAEGRDGKSLARALILTLTPPLTKK